MEALQRLHNRGSISTGYDIDNSCKFEADNGEHLYVTTMTSGNRRTWTYSIWFKRTELGFTNVLIHFGVNNQATRMMLNDDDTLHVDVCDTGSTLYRSITNRLFRDTSAWYHVVLRVDTTQGTEADRMRVYINGVEETSWSQHQIPPQNLDTLANTTVGAYDAMGIGTYVWAGGSYDGLFSGYIAQVAHVDGQSYAATEFGEFDEDSGIWKPKDITELTYGSSNNSFLLDFSDSSDLGNDSSGNNNDWSLTNITSVDQATDTPTNNFAVFNSIYDYDGSTITEGATQTQNSTTANWRSMVSNIAVQNGKWYAEFKATHNGSFVGTGLVEEMTGDKPKTEYLGQMGESIGYYGVGLLFYSGASQTGSFAGFTTGDIIGIALDKDNGYVYWHKNGTWQNSGDPTSGSSGTGGVALSSGYAGYSQSDYYIIGYSHASTNTAYANFGGYTSMTISSAESDGDGYGTFEYAPPSGYYAICTKNLEEYG